MLALLGSVCASEAYLVIVVVVSSGHLEYVNKVEPCKRRKGTVARSRDRYQVEKDEFVLSRWHYEEGGGL